MSNKEDTVNILLNHNKNQHVKSLEKSIKGQTRNITKLFDNIYKMKCIICLENQIEYLFNCGHAVTCRNCYNQIPVPKLCPLCRIPITNLYTNIEARSFNT